MKEREKLKAAKKEENRCGKNNQLDIQLTVYKGRT